MDEGRSSDGADGGSGGGGSGEGGRRHRDGSGGASSDGDGSLSDAALSCRLTDMRAELDELMATVARRQQRRRRRRQQGGTDLASGTPNGARGGGDGGSGGGGTDGVPPPPLRLPASTRAPRPGRAWRRCGAAATRAWTLTARRTTTLCRWTRPTWRFSRPPSTRGGGGTPLVPLRPSLGMQTGPRRRRWGTRTEPRRRRWGTRTGPRRSTRRARQLPLQWRRGVEMALLRQWRRRGQASKMKMLPLMPPGSGTEGALVVEGTPRTARCSTPLRSWWSTRGLFRFTSVITALSVDLLLFHHFNTLDGQQDQWSGSAFGTVTARIGVAPGPSAAATTTLAVRRCQDRLAP
ncbi:hypothetical protein BU14_0505s0023 [Porphyra umbilicalis]|uniref:Uncharacterized protein n=1 Tax=Porphyra umbilicalis TaxID=2786 RepID=A0A1X6NT07_PORUM|nr:hypothetical protein BU14_0505s0023 [Porphyra umbilicalis]|eukprot:OSX71742.1 hypothetical protein BU14_0505s0023 [Porphyra umbilicalis]